LVSGLQLSLHESGDVFATSPANSRMNGPADPITSLDDSSHLSSSFVLHVQRLGEAASLDQETVERLVCEAGERLEDDRIYHDLARRPLGEIVALICKDLGLEPDWDGLAGEYWAAAEIARPPPGSPYAGWKARRVEAPPPPVPSG
jgi:hypothetical protein